MNRIAGYKEGEGVCYGFLTFCPHCGKPMIYLNTEYIVTWLGKAYVLGHELVHFLYRIFKTPFLDYPWEVVNQLGLKILFSIYTFYAKFKHRA